MIEGDKVSEFEDRWMTGSVIVGLLTFIPASALVYGATESAPLAVAAIIAALVVPAALTKPAGSLYRQLLKLKRRESHADGRPRR